MRDSRKVFPAAFVIGVAGVAVGLFLGALAAPHLWVKVTLAAAVVAAVAAGGEFLASRGEEKPNV